MGCGEGCGIGDAGCKACQWSTCHHSIGIGHHNRVERDVTCVGDGEGIVDHVIEVSDAIAIVIADRGHTFDDGNAGLLGDFEMGWCILRVNRRIRFIFGNSAVRRCAESIGGVVEETPVNIFLGQHIARLETGLIQSAGCQGDAGGWQWC